MTVTREQAQHLTALARAIRPHGAPRWDEAGIFAALAKVKSFDLAEVAMVTVVGAADRNLDTPAAIGNTRSPLWQGRWRNPDAPQVRQPYDPQAACHICGKPEDACRRNEHSGHEFEAATEYARRLAHDPRRKETKQ